MTEGQMLKHCTPSFKEIKRALDYKIDATFSMESHHTKIRSRKRRQNR